MDLIPESKKNHLWRKTIWHTNPEEHPLGPAHSAEVYCCEESNGFSVWYARRLGKNDSRGRADTTNGDYLLNFYPVTARDAAIERAVLIANSVSGDEQIIQALDNLAKSAQKV